MKSSKKILTGILTTVMSLSSLGINSFASSGIPVDVEGTRFVEPIRILQALDIMNGDGDGKFRPNDTIKRSEVAKMAVLAMGLGDAAEAAGGESVFPDVGTDHWANGYINVANSQGLVVGYDTGLFMPDNQITYAEAMTIFVRAMGYDVFAQEKGGYPQGYIVAGSNNGLTKNVQGSNQSPITRGNVAFMTVNALNGKMMKQTGFGEDAKWEITDETLLTDVLDVTKGSGQVTAIENTALTGNATLKPGYIRINNEAYETAYNMNNLLGYNVTYYAKEDELGDKKIILALADEGKNKTFEISSDLMIDITDRSSYKTINYYKNEDATSSSYVTLDNNLTLIYNGKYEALDYDLIDIAGKSGKVVLLDTDNNGRYDIAFVTEYSDIVVEEVTSTNKIIDKYGRPTLKLDDENDDLIYSITLGADELKLSDLKEYDVLSVAESKDKLLYEIKVSRDTVSGKITGIDEEGYEIDGKLYKISPNFTEDIAIGTEGVFYLDVMGKIAGVDTTVSVSSNYAYLLRAATSDATEESTFKLFTKEGKEVTLTANEKIRFNGVGGTLASDVVEQLKDAEGTKKQLIIYSLNNDGKIASIHTATEGEVNENVFTKNFVYENQKFNAKTNKIGDVRLTSKTIIFDINEDSADYKMGKLSMFEDGSSYNITVYDMGYDSVAKAIVVTDSNLQTNAESSVAVVQKVNNATNDDEEITEVLTAFKDGKEVKVFAEDIGILVKGDNEKLETGDIIQYVTNANGEITNIRVLFNIDEKETEKETEVAENLKTVYGRVTKKFADSMNVRVNGGTIMNFELPDDINVYSVDTSLIRNNVSVVTTGDIQSYDEDEGNRVFVKIYKDVVTEVVIIK
ncbi:MAG: S-layer homology domain-containing protein [Ruminococcaceae bacterium]|nr:S-layer homology domain-containing protein [Oscillospiraceae bacterium]